MIDKYYDFNVDKFFGDIATHRARYTELKHQLEQIPTEGGMDYSVPRVSGGVPSDTVFQKVSRREYVHGLMGRLEIVFDLYEAIWGLLNDEEKAIVEIYWMDTKTPKKILIRSLSKKLNLVDKAVYNRIVDLRRKIREYVDAEMGK